MADNSPDDHNIVQLPDGRLMGYARYGDPNGRPLLAIHGTPGSRIMMQPADQFARQNKIMLIAPDRPGYGLSTACPDYCFVQWTSDIKTLLASLKIDRFWLFGVSGGGPFASALAALMPQRVHGMALVSPVGIFDQEGRRDWCWRHRLFFGALPRHPVLAKPVLHLARFSIMRAPIAFLKIFAVSLAAPDQLILKDPRHQNALLAAFHDALASGVSGLTEDLRLFATPWQIPLNNIEAPVIFWQGSQDQMVPERAAYKLAHSIVGVEIVPLPGQGHFWIFDHFEDVLRRLMDL